MVALFLGASIPMMEKRSLERRPEYQDVIDRVSKFVPRPPRAASMSAPRVAGDRRSRDSGLLTAIRLARDPDVDGISAKPGLVSGQELGCSCPPADYARATTDLVRQVPRPDRVRRVQAELTGLDVEARTVHGQEPTNAPSPNPARW